MDINSSFELAYQLRELYGDYSPLGLAVSSFTGQRYFSLILSSVCGDWFNLGNLPVLLWDFYHHGPHLDQTKPRKWKCKKSDWRNR